MMKDTLGKFKPQTGISPVTVESIGVPDQAVNLTISPTVSEINVEKTGVDTPLGTRFTVFAMGFNVLGLAAVNFGNLPIAGNAVVADIVLATSLVCLSASLFRSMIGEKSKKIQLWLFSKQPTA